VGKPKPRIALRNMPVGPSELLAVSLLLLNAAIVVAFFFCSAPSDSQNLE
jgi:hypothetical protein